MKSRFFLIFVFLATVFACKSPDGRRGVCQPLKDCEELNIAIRKRTLNRQDFAAYKNGCKDKKNTFCCPIEAKEVSTEKLRVENCGKQNVQYNVVGGEETEINEFPWAVLLEFNDTEKNTLEYTCGGTLINERYVLTAAHCVTKKEKLQRVRIGEWNTDEPSDCSPNNEKFCSNDPIDNYVVDIKIHPQYSLDKDNKDHHNDIALLRLAKILEFNQFVRPICLPINEEGWPEDFTGHSLVVTGWGYSDPDIKEMSNIKLKATLEGTEMKNCTDFYKITSRMTYPDKQICAGGQGGEQDSCNGDSGGPLMYQLGDAWFLAGIVSYGDNNCNTTKPSLYTKVSSYIQWIASNIRD